MRSLIFVGGLQYSGKTTLCKTLNSSDSKYKHLALDDSYEYIALHRDVFMNIIKKDNRDLFSKIKKLGKKCGIEGKADQMTLFANYMIKENRFDEFSELHRKCTLLYTGSLLSRIEDNEVPMIDGIMVNKVSRKTTYNSLKSSITKENIDDSKKLIVYFNFGLKKSLERFKSANREEKKSMLCNEDTITSTYTSQELPVPGELPNLNEVWIINNESDINESVKHILANY
jgi:hypothetical protein